MGHQQRIGSMINVLENSLLFLLFKVQDCVALCKVMLWHLLNIEFPIKQMLA